MFVGENLQYKSLNLSINDICKKLTYINLLTIFAGELEYADFPFQGFWSYVSFIVFVFVFVLVMMNLLTGMALLDVTEIKNQTLGN